MSELELNEAQLEKAIKSLNLFLDHYETPRKLARVPKQDDSIWSPVTGTAQFRSDFDSALAHLQERVESVWTSMRGIAHQLQATGRELKAADEASADTLQSLEKMVERFDEKPSLSQDELQALFPHLGLPGLRGQLPLKV